MNRPTHSRTFPSLLAAVLTGIAAFAILAPGPARAGGARDLAVELRVTQGDLARLAAGGLPAAQAEGLRARVTGALGLLPWQLALAGSGAAADRLAGWSGDLAAPDDLATLAAEIAALARAHPFDLAARIELAPPGAALAEAAALHDEYCAGCHDTARGGDPADPLGARELRRMAAEAPGEIFLARLVHGIKGDESLAFRSPVTDAQLLALYAFYRRPAAD